MIKELAIIANIIGSAYFMGGMLIQHDKAKELLVGMDKGFKGLLYELNEKQPTEVVRMLLKLFGILTGLAFVGILLMGILKVHSQQLAFILSITFLLAGILSGSLFWVLKHKEVIKQFGQWLLFFGGGSLLFPVMDILSNAGITHVIYSMLQASFSPLFTLPNGNGLVYEAMIVTGFYVGFIVFFYIIAWLYAAPIAVVAWVLVATPIFCAGAINRMFPKEPIAVIFFALWLFSVFYFAYASNP